MSDDFLPDDREIDLRALLGLLRRQLRLIIVSFVVVVMVAALVVFSLTPKYTASALILVDPAQKNLLDPNSANTSGVSESSRVESEAEIIRSDSTLLEVINDQKLVSDPEFGVSLGLRAWLTGILRISDVKLPTGKEALHQVLANLQKAVHVERRGLTYLIDISVDSDSPDRAATLANAIANAYIHDQVQAKIAATIASRDILQRRLDQAKLALSESETSLDDFVFQNVDRIVSETGETKLSDLRKELTLTDQKRLEASHLADLVAKGIDQRDWQTLQQSLESDAAKALERQRADLISSLAGLDPTAQRAVDLKAELAKIEDELTKTARIELSGLKKDVATAESGIANLKGEIRTAALNSDLPADLLTNIYGLQQNAAVSRNQYQLLLSRLRDVEAQAELQLPDSRVVSPAIPPNRPSFPKTTLMLGASGLIGLMLGIVLAYLRENYIGGFVSDRQVESVLHIPVSASVPRLKLSGSGGQGPRSPAETIVAEPISVFSESVRRLRAGIDQSMDRLAAAKSTAAAGGTVIMVTSAVPGEGKSSLSLSLGRTYALAGRSTIVIDCDLRKPSVHRHLDLEPSAGLFDYLASKGEGVRIDDILIQDPLTPLAIITGMRRANAATDQLVVGAAFDKLLDAATKSFEIVILDAPPIGPIVDGLYLAKRADIIAMVIQWAQTSQEDARRALSGLQSAKRPETQIQAVLNATDNGPSSYGGRYSGYFEQSY